MANRSLLRKIIKLPPHLTLIIVSCTKEKIWDNSKEASQFVKAKSVYKGKDFKNFVIWYYSNNLREKGYYWMILSGKYGFIEPNHPISWYDINMSEPEHHPISKASLNNQVKQIRKWKVDNNIYTKLKLNKFKNILCINCDNFYIRRIKQCFGKINYIEHNFENSHQMSH